MGSALHRLQVLMIGLTLLIASTVVVVLMYVRPPAQHAYLLVTPEPVAGQLHSATPAPTAAAPATPTAVPVRVSKDIGVSYPWPWITPSLAEYPWIERLDVRWALWLVAAAGAALLIVAGRVLRRPRMAYTGQSVRMLFARADKRTRTANQAVLRRLQIQGKLPSELAVAAGLGPRRPRHLMAQFTNACAMLRLPHHLRTALKGVARPRLALHRPHLPRIAMWRRRPAARAVPALDFTPLPVLPTDEQGRSVLSEPSPQPAPSTADEIAPSKVDHGRRDDVAGVWSAEDRALGVAAWLHALWREHALTSPVLWVDTANRTGAAAVAVLVDPAPAEETRLLAVPDLLVARNSGWQARWTHQDGKLLLHVAGCDRSDLSAQSPLLIPLLTHGRASRLLRFVPLETWRILGLYGGNAAGALHMLLTSLLYAHSPFDLALAILDQGQVSPLYEGVAHRVIPLEDISTTVRLLTLAVRRFDARRKVRPMLLIVVEPDDAALATLTHLVASLGERPDVPLYLMVVQERPSAAGREIYARLPALITGRSTGSPALLPGQQEWPAGDEARFAGRGVRVSGRAQTLSEAEVASALASLPRVTASLPPVIWDAWCSGDTHNQHASTTLDQPASEEHDE
jgi:hypothetical protein